MKINEKCVNAIVDLAVSYEDKDLSVAKQLMNVARTARPNNKSIGSKIGEYNSLLKAGQVRLGELVASGEVAIIPIGFRCFTKKIIFQKLGINQASLPFDSGFFTSESVASVLHNPCIALSYPDDGLTHKVCIKSEHLIDEKKGKYIQFKTSSYEEVHSIVSSKANKAKNNLNSYLDGTFGYYTLDLQHEYVLAHFNWHHFSNVKHSKGINNPTINLQILNDKLNQRIKRMFSLCENAKRICFVYFEHQGYDFMRIDDKYIDVNNASLINDVVKDRFPLNSTVVNINDLNNAQELINLLGLD